MQVFIIPNLQKDPQLKYTAEICKTLQEYGIFCIMEESLKNDLAFSVSALNFDIRSITFTARSAALALCDIAVTVGGDGTMLHEAEDLFFAGKMLLGVNLGRVGFLSALEPDEIHYLKNLASGDYFVEQRSLLQVQVSGGQPMYALNEAVIAKGSLARAIGFEMHCDGTFVDSYRGDGLIVATPTGSTAYSLSAGGPIVDAKLAATIVTPICAHRLASPSLVFSGERVLAVYFGADAAARGETTYLTLDGAKIVNLAPQDTITFTHTKNTLKIIYFKKVHQFTSISQKLK